MITNNFSPALITHRLTSIKIPFPSACVSPFNNILQISTLFIPLFLNFNSLSNILKHNDGPMNDPGHRGVCNLLRFALGGTPATTTPAILPVSSRQSGNLVFEYDRGASSRPPNALHIVEYGRDLSGWTPVTVPYSTSGPVTVTLGAATDHVKVVVPTAGTKVFARLRVIAN